MKRSSYCGGLEIPSLFAGTHAIVIDELHALLDNERGVHLRSLLTRLELAVGRRIRRVGLSATLGQMTLAREYLRPEAPDSVVLLKSKSDDQELKVQLRGYREEGDPSRSQEEREDEFFRATRGSLSTCSPGYAAAAT